jgi:hypothetical protein
LISISTSFVFLIPCCAWTFSHVLFLHTLPDTNTDSCLLSTRMYSGASPTLTLMKPSALTAYIPFILACGNTYLRSWRRSSSHSDILWRQSLRISESLMLLIHVT